MPRSAADVRRRGDQIRRRRNALVAGGAALAVGAVTVPIWALSGSAPQADSPPVTDGTDPAVALSEADLLTAEETEYFERGAYRTVATRDAEGEAFHPCQQSRLAALGATSVYERDFEFIVPPDAGDVVDVPGDGLVEAAAQFPDAASAAAAYDRFAEWVLDCDGRIDGAEDTNVVPQARSVEVPGGDAVIYDVSWGPAPEEADPFGDAAYINETGLLLVGDRIAVLSLTIVGQDYNFLDEDGGTPVNRMLPTAAARLQPGAALPSATPDAAPSPGAGTVSLLGDGLDLVQEMVSNDSGEPVLAEPDGDGVGEVRFCDTAFDPGAAAVERLAANASGPEYGDAREVLVLPTAEEAESLATGIVDAARACPRTEAGGTTTLTEVGTREDQPLRTSVISQTYETDGVAQLGTTTWVVAHEGPLVLLAVSSDEGSADPGSVAATTEDLLGRLRVTMEWVLGLSER